MALVVCLAFVAPAICAPAKLPTEDSGHASLASISLSTQITETERALNEATVTLEALHQSWRIMDARMRRIRDRAQVHVLGREFAAAVVAQQHALPDPDVFTAGRAARENLLVVTSNSRIRIERELDQLEIAGSASDSEVPATIVSSNGVSVAVHGVRGAELARLAGIQRDLIKTLQETDKVEKALEIASAAAFMELKQMLFWMPTRFDTTTASEIPGALAWFLSLENWRSAWEAMERYWKRSPLFPTVVVVAALCLIAFRHRLVRKLSSPMPVTRVSAQFSTLGVARVLVTALSLSAPGPIIMWVAGTLLDAAPASERFASSLGLALLVTARLLFVLNFSAFLLHPGGFAVRALGWDAQALAFVSRAVRRFTLMFAPLFFVAMLNGLVYAPFSSRESLGRLMFCITMVGLAALLMRVFRRSGLPMQTLRAHSERSWMVQFHSAWFGVVLSLPIGLAVASLMGYFVAAEYFFGRLVISMVVVQGIILLRALLIIWANANETAVSSTQGGNLNVTAPRSATRDIGEEKRSIINLLIVIVALSGLWSVWRDALPLLSVVGDHPLWTYTSSVQGKEVFHALTVSGLLTALIIAAVSIVVVRNISGFLDVVLLKRVDMRADTSFAVKVIARYLVILTGVILASRKLGMGWDDVQWLVAALSVGLGFGLQEIFGNLVAGLMMLAERPVRIGDIVTVGDVTGTVTRIQARATTVTDFDNKEILIPNKAFITDRVINWTLSNQITRLLLKVSVPRGTNVERVQTILLGVVQSNREVSTALPPAVLCLGLVDKALEFEVSVFVDAFNKRRRVQHELNGAIDLALRENGIVG